MLKLALSEFVLWLSQRLVITGEGKKWELHKYSRHTFALCAPFMPDEKAGNVNTKKGSMLKD